MWGEDLETAKKRKSVATPVVGASGAAAWNYANRAVGPERIGSCGRLRGLIMRVSGFYRRRIAAVTAVTVGGGVLRKRGRRGESRQPSTGLKGEKVGLLKGEC